MQEVVGHQILCEELRLFERWMRVLHGDEVVWQEETPDDVVEEPPTQILTLLGHQTLGLTVVREDEERTSKRPGEELGEGGFVIRDEVVEEPGSETRCLLVLLEIRSVPQKAPGRVLVVRNSGDRFRQELEICDTKKNGDYRSDCSDEDWLRHVGCVLGIGAWDKRIS